MTCGSVRPVRGEYALPKRKSSITGIACLHRAIGAADRPDRLERRARVDRARAHLIDLGAREPDREEEEDVLAAQRRIARHVDVQVVGVAVGVERDAPEAAAAAAARDAARRRARAAGRVRRRRRRS